MKAWIKGGLIGLGIILFIFVANILIDISNGKGLFEGEFSMFLFILVSFPFFEILRILDNPLTGKIAFGIYSLFIFIIYFGIGALIGWIIQKIKSQ